MQLRLLPSVSLLQQFLDGLVTLSSLFTPDMLNTSCVLNRSISMGNLFIPSLWLKRTLYSYNTLNFNTSFFSFRASPISKFKFSFKNPWLILYNKELVISKQQQIHFYKLIFFLQNLFLNLDATRNVLRHLRHDQSQITIDL